jgi:hypothetical protein
MTRDDIIRMAREAGWISEYDSPTGFCAEAAFKFAALVATAVAEPVQEPVAWANSFDLQNFDMKVRTGPDLHHTVPLYTAPTKREWVGLTADEIWKCNRAKSGSPVEFHICNAHQNVEDFAEAIEAKLKEKNGG